MPKLEIVRNPASTTGTGRKSESATEIRLGDRVKDLRRLHRWTLDNASERVGLSRSALSKIERGEASPTFDAMQKLAHGFGLDLVEFLSPADTTTPTGRRSITRVGEGTTYETPDYTIRLLMEDLKITAFVATEIVVSARSFSEYVEWDRHPSEDFIYVLQGRMILYTELYSPVTLNKGDAVYFDANMGHACVSIGQHEARALWITSTNKGEVCNDN